MGAHGAVGAVIAARVDPAEDELAPLLDGDPLRLGGEGGEHRLAGAPRAQGERDEGTQALRPEAGVDPTVAERRAPEAGR